MASRKRIGELLVAANVITQEQLAEALAKPRKEGQRLGDVLVAEGMVSETQLTQALSQQLAIPWVSLYHVDFSRQLLNMVPHEIADRYCLVPVLYRKSKKGGEQLFVAMDDPTNDTALADVSQACGGMTVKPMIAARSDILAAIRVYYLGETVAAPQVPQPPPSAPGPPVAAPAAPEPPAESPPAKAQPRTIPPEDLVEEEPSIPPTAPAPAAPEPPPRSVDSPDASPEIEAREITPKKKRVPMIALTLLDGTTIQLPARRGRTPSQPAAAETETELTARDLVSALRAVAHGADGADILGEAPRWEPIVATLLSLLLRKGLVADWEFLEEYRKI
jgi:type IV pilus assembly protein PilB